MSLAALGSALALFGVSCGSNGDEGSNAGGGAAQAIEIVETEFELNPSTVSVDGPGTYTFRALNEGETVHALEIEGPGIEEETEDIQAGESAELRVELSEPGEYELYCPVDGHREQGMEGTLEVGGTGGGTTEETTTEESDDDGLGY